MKTQISLNIRWRKSFENITKIDTKIGNKCIFFEMINFRNKIRHNKSCYLLCTLLLNLINLHLKMCGTRDNLRYQKRFSKQMYFIYSYKDKYSFLLQPRCLHILFFSCQKTALQALLSEKMNDLIDTLVVGHVSFYLFMHKSNYWLRI